MKMYVILRKDIYMDAGKAAAQAGHAFAHVTVKALRCFPERYTSYLPADYIFPGVKVVLQANCEEMNKIQKECERKELPVWTMWDSGHIFLPDFDGKTRVMTAVGIGPLFQEEAQELLGTLELFAVNEKLKHRKVKSKKQ